MATTFCLVRHAAYASMDCALGGRAAHPLSAEGRVQADRLAAAIRGQAIAAVVSSPIQRARETALPIAAQLGLPVQIEEDFTEIDFAGWTGMGFDALHNEPAWRAWNAFRNIATVPGGEAMLAVQARALNGLRRRAMQHPDGEVVVVSHSDVIKALLGQILGAPLDLLRRMEISPGSISRVVLYAEDAKVLGMNLQV